ncbi:MAG: basic secretory protein-like protein [Acidobacteriota bacterium]|nr:basic secretory protein-like protein [Acidobacteriota bacterium]
MRTPSITRKRTFAALLISGLVFFSASLEAQYFGRNKVQYERFDFKVMKTRHFDIYFYLTDQETVKQAAIMAERWYTRLARVLNHELKGRQPLILYSSNPQFHQTTAISGTLGEGTGGVTEAFKRRIVLPYGATLAETDHVIGHELVHAFQYDIASQGRSDQARGMPVDMRLPLWFIEGLAEYLSIGAIDPLTSMWMRDAVKKKDLPEIRKLNDSYKYFPYRWGHAFWSYITGRWGDEIIARLMKAAGRSDSAEPALEGVLGVKIKQLSKDWHEAMKKAYEPVLPLTQAFENYGKALIQGSEQNSYNIAPALSPDGKELIFLSSRDLFSIDLFLADAETGKVKRNIISTAVDPHFESLQFIQSAGAWDFEGRRFVFGAIAKGRPILTIIDVRTDKIEKEIPFPELGEIMNPAWSPDGRHIAFSALAGGQSDIFIYDLQTSTLRQMTRDFYSDIHPAWSPDGRHIAFVTDRFSTTLSNLSIGNYELALMEPESGQMERLGAFPNGKNINPQWSSDSKSIYFLSDQTGKTDIYRLDLGSRRIFQVTNLYTGVAGITELSPAISFSAKEKKLVFSGYNQGYFTLYSVESEEILRGTAELASFGETNLGVLPPRTQAEGSLLALLKNPIFGLPKDTNFPVSEYKPKLSLYYITQPTVAVGVDRYGTYGGGGLAAFWSDMLGYRTVVTMAQVNSRLIDSALLVAYQNSRKRWNWGVVGQRIPYVYGYYGATIGETMGEPSYIEEELVFRQINYEASAFAFYPFSQVKRLELSGGFQLIDFSQTLYTRSYSLYGEYLLNYDKKNLEAPKSISYAFTSAALVYDSGIFGATSPILGQSYLLELSPAVGSLSFMTAMADYRRYLMPVKPFTLAFRFLHYGRYGKSADDERLWPLYIGYEDLVRGYGYSSFDFNETFDGNRLFGSKLLIANFELRFPLFRVLGLGSGFYGIWPIEFLGFYDIGVAWDDVNEASFLGGSRKPVSSAGIGLRTNLFNYLVLGLNYVYPFDRPQKGWHLQFTITPGF